jgi:hypothetical protein
VHEVEVELFRSLEPFVIDVAIDGQFSDLDLALERRPIIG